LIFASDFSSTWNMHVAHTRQVDNFHLKVCYVEY